jgi:hypothetical protein
MAGLVKIIMVITAWVLFIAMGIMFCSFGSSNEAGNAP